MTMNIRRRPHDIALGTLREHAVAHPDPGASSVIDTTNHEASTLNPATFPKHQTPPAS